MLTYWLHAGFCLVHVDNKDVWPGLDQGPLDLDWSDTSMLPYCPHEPDRNQHAINKT